MNLCMRRALFVIILAVPTLLLKCVGYIDEDEETSDNCTGSTKVIATNYRSTYPFLLDDDALYIQRSVPGLTGSQPGGNGTLISRIDKITGDTSTLKFTGTENVILQCLDGAFAYFAGRQDVGLYRASKAGGVIELVKSFTDAIHRVKVVDNKVCATMRSEYGLFCSSISHDSITKVTDKQVSWFDIDEHSLFWAEARRDSVTQLRTIWEMKHGGGAPIKRVTGDFGGIQMMSEYICYWSDSTGDLMRFRKDGGEPELLFPSHPVLFSDEDDAYVLVDDMLYVSNCGGGLWKFPAKDPVNGAAMLDKWGAFDDDDYSPKLVSDGVALYWFAGPDVNTRISDDDMGVLLKTCITP